MPESVLLRCGRHGRQVFLATSSLLAIDERVGPAGIWSAWGPRCAHSAGIGRPWRQAGRLSGDGGSLVATSGRQLDEEDDEDEEAPASALDRFESELEPESTDESLADESLDGSEPLAEESFDEAASFSLCRLWALAPWSFL